MKAALALVLATLMWAGNYIVGHAAVQTMSPLSLTWLRWLLAAVPLLVLAQVLEKPDWRRVARAWPRLLLLAALGLAGYNLLLYAALQHTSALSASLINAANPAVMVLLAAFILRERMGWRGVAGLALGLAGVLLILTKGDLASVLTLGHNAGDLLMVGAIVVWSLYTIFGKGLTSVPPITSTAAQATIIAVLLAPVSLTLGVDWPADRVTLSALLFIALFPSVGAYALWNAALKTIPSGRAGLFLNLITVFTVVISLVMGASLTAAQAAGGLLVFAGVGLSAMRPRRPALDMPAAGAPAAADAADREDPEGPANRAHPTVTGRGTRPTAGAARTPASRP
ncbi:DMT family transporter [Georgenia sp. SYP-B2076]|uniref:DMT family transporter n=1 Tax=Georgenia sp. SYP-B2076 TaxID=2495881 RepID=UPI000F8C60B5|nr:DMT family transporter [Georgenia sp. SYP-B2076]